MIKVLIGSSLLVFSSLSFAQIDIDARTVNERNATEINNEASARSQASRSALANVAHAIGGHIKKSFQFTASPIPAARDLSEHEEAQKKVIQCADKILAKNKGGYDAPSIAQKILMKAITKDLVSLEETRKDCWKLYNDLFNFSNGSLNSRKYINAVDALPVKTREEIKSKNLITALMNWNEDICRITDASFSAGFLMKLGAGVSIVRCLESNGKVKTFAGPQFRFNAGFGFDLQIDRNEIADNNVGKAGILAVYGDDNECIEADGCYTPIIGNIETDMGYWREQPVKGFALGLKADMIQTKFGANIRLFNGKRRWHLLTNHLN